MDMAAECVLHRAVQVGAGLAGVFYEAEAVDELQIGDAGRGADRLHDGAGEDLLRGGRGSSARPV